MDQLTIDYQDVEKFLANYYWKCPVHKRSIMCQRLDDKDDLWVIKCQKCLEQKNVKSILDIVDLFQSDNNTIFNQWPIYYDNQIIQRLQEIGKQQFDQKFNEVNHFFDELQSQIDQAIQAKRKEVIKYLAQIYEIKLEPINYYNQISQKERLIEILKTQYGDQAKQNQMILNIIKENELNYEQNKQKIVDLINRSAKNNFYLTKIKNMMDEVLSVINILEICDYLQSNQLANQPNDIQQISNESNKNRNIGCPKQNVHLIHIFNKANINQLEETLIAKFEDLQKCQNFKKIRIDFKNSNLNEQVTQGIADCIDNCNKIIKLTLELSKTNMDDERFTKIASRLIKHQYMQNLSINLDKNSIGLQGAKQIANAIEQYQHIAQLTLSLNHNQIGDKGVIIISSSIKQYKSIIGLYLQLQNNKISVEGTDSLAKKITSVIV
ncbi:hypothetical protein ABPG72_000505 [Tetrahymena utriculariae]